MSRSDHLFFFPFLLEMLSLSNWVYFGLPPLTINNELVSFPTTKLDESLLNARPVPMITLGYSRDAAYSRAC